MKFSENWLRNWVNPPVDTPTLAEALTMAGLEVDAVEPITAASLDKVFVGEVLTAEPHPNADRLRICTVNLGEETPPLSIVCGASNVRAGLKVAVAIVGAVLPGNFKIKEAKIRGLASFGMICSSSELQLTETSEGIMELPNNAPVGLPFAEYLQLPDHIIDVSITPNRGDCLSIQGLAREISAIFDIPPTPPNIHPIPHTINETRAIQLQAPVHCPRYAGRIIRDLDPNAVTPLWMMECLRRSGIRSIHPVVDITNYVMLELGQPMHAFDLATIAGDIQVRESGPGEQVTLLDQQTITLDHPTLVIADQQKILAMAGLMGGASSAVSEHTTDIFLESAFFTTETISQSLKHYPIHSDASHRFERGIDPEATLIAMHRATELLLSITSGTPGPIVDIQDAIYFPKPFVIELRKPRIKRILGIDLEASAVLNILHKLGLKSTEYDNSWHVTIPRYRSDLRLEIDLIEELARIHGYNSIPSHHMTAPLVMAPCPENELSEKRIRNLLLDYGYHESISYSFIPPELAKLLSPHHSPIPLSNPISADMSVMRTSLWPGLIQAALFNLHRQQSRLQLFEIGVCFLNAENHALTQPAMLAGMILGNLSHKQWAQSPRPVDFFDLKGDVEAIFALTQDTASITFAENTHLALHPGRSANIQKNGQTIGYLGALHPDLQQSLGFGLDLHTTPYLFEIQLSEITTIKLPSYQTPSKYPSIRRDLAFIIEKKLPYKKIRDIIEASSGNTLKHLQLFDVYEGAGVGEGKKSIALHLTFQSNSRTLTDKEIDSTITQIIATLKQDLQITLRE